MKKLFVIGFLVMAIVGQAQITRGVRGGYNTENFPEISFVWNSPNPAPMDKSQFILMENDQPVNFSFSQVDGGQPGTCKKSILILWEDMKSHRLQTDKSRELLLEFFRNTSVDRNDVFNIAVFNRKSPNEDLLHFLLPEFVQDNDRLVQAVRNYEKSTSDFSPYPLQSDLYLAIDEGINLLKREPADRVGIIVVVTAGLNMKAAGATTEMETVRQSANEAGIPIYVVKYYEPSGDAPEVNTLAEKTYGQTIRLSSDSVGNALADLRALYRNLDNRCYGRDYRITFTTSASRDGKTHPLLLTVDRAQQQLPAFTAPEMTFRLWLQDHKLLFAALVLLAMGLMVLIILLIVGASRRRKEREEAHEAKIHQELDATRKEKQQWMLEQEAKEARKQAEEEEKRRLEEEARLMQLMQTKNLFPRLQCGLPGSAFSYTIQRPFTRIGRLADNDVVLDHQTVSKHHAEIRFTGTAFEVVNKSATYKQGIIVNGQFFQKTTLKNGDIIGLGEAVITFYV